MHTAKALLGLLLAGCTGGGAELIGERGPVAVADVGAAAPDDAWGVGRPEAGAFAGPVAIGPAIVRYDGETWSTAWESSGAALRGVWGAAPDDVWAVGSVLGVAVTVHYDGVAWSETALPAREGGTDELYDVSGAGPADVWAVGTTDASGTFAALVTRFDGSSWTLQPGPPAEALIGVHVTPAGVVWVLSREAVFRRDGETWTRLETGLLSGARRIGESEGRIWIGGPAGIAVFEDGAFVALDTDATATLRGSDALLHGDVRVFSTFDHGSTSCTFSGCTEGTSTTIATLHLRSDRQRTVTLRSIELEPSEHRTVSLENVRFFAIDAELWVLGPSYWRIAL